MVKNIDYVNASNNCNTFNGCQISYIDDIKMQVYNVTRGDKMLGEIIRSLRKENNLSQEELAEKLGVSRQSISLWENGQTMPSMDNIIAISSIFNVSTDVLLKDVDDNSVDEAVAGKGKKSYKKVLITILMLLVVVSVSTVAIILINGRNTNKKLSAEDVYDLITPCTVEINAIGDTFENTGTGFFIESNGVILTNYHVIESCHTINITTAQGNTYKAENVLGFDKDRDLAIIQANCQNEYVVEVNTEKIKTGEKVYTLGSSLGLTGTFSEGIISSSSREIAGLEYIQITAPISSGNSGGPLVDEYGKVIGITTGAFADGQNLNLAIPARAIKTINRDNTYPIKDFFLISQGKIVEQEQKASKNDDAPYGNYIPIDVGYFDSLSELEEAALRNPDIFKVPVTISVNGTIIRTNNDNIYLTNSNQQGLKIYRAKINGITESEAKEMFNIYDVFMIDDSNDRVLTGDKVIITGIYRHSAKTLSDCTYEFAE